MTGPSLLLAVFECVQLGVGSTEHRGQWWRQTGINGRLYEVRHLLMRSRGLSKENERRGVIVHEVMSLPLVVSSQEVS